MTQDEKKYTVEQQIGGLIDSFSTIAHILQEQVLDRVTIDGDEILRLASYIEKYATELSSLVQAGNFEAAVVEVCKKCGERFAHASTLASCPKCGELISDK